MKPRLKQFRVAANMTQAKVAAAVGVTQPNYQRWESGSAPIPEDKLKKLSKVLKTTPEAILGRHPPIEAAFYDRDAPEKLQYYGEVAIHFVGGGASLLLSISEAAHSELYRDLQTGGRFVTVESLANQTVVLRTKAISDLYFSSEAYDDFGPEHETYNHISLQLPDTRDWEIVERLAVGGEIDDFDPADVERVQSMVMITDDQYRQLVADGHIKAEDLEAERAKNDAKTNQIFELATDTTYQLSTGQKRRIYIDGSEAVYESFWELVEFDGDDQGTIRIPAEGYHRTIFLNPDAVDYITIPTHQFEQGRIEATADAIDSLESSEEKGLVTARGKKR